MHVPFCDLEEETSCLCIMHVPFCDLEEETDTTIPTTTAAVDDVHMTTRPTTLTYTSTSDYPVRIGGWIYMIWIVSKLSKVLRSRDSSIQ